MSEGGGTRSLVLLFQGLVFLWLGLLVSYLGFLDGSAQVNLNEVLGPVLFWVAALELLIAFPLRRYAREWLSAVRTRLGALVFWPYITLHLVIYGLLLELILGSVLGFSLTLSATLTFSTNSFSPPSLLAALADVAFSPSVIFTLPPIFSGALSLYSLCIAVLVDMLVVVNVLKASDLRRLSRAGGRAKAYFLLPAVGVVLGASCCLSVPALVALIAPSVARSSLFDWVYSITYFFFPAFAIVVLYANARAADRIGEALTRGL